MRTSLLLLILQSDWKMSDQPPAPHVESYNNIQFTGHKVFIYYTLFIQLYPCLLSLWKGRSVGLFGWMVILFIDHRDAVVLPGSSARNWDVSGSGSVTFSTGHKTRASWGQYSWIEGWKRGRRHCRAEMRIKIIAETVRSRRVKPLLPTDTVDHMVLLSGLHQNHYRPGISLPSPD